MGRAKKRTEEHPPKLVFGIDRVCTRCKGKGDTNYEKPCRLCGGKGFTNEGVPNGKG